MNSFIGFKDVDLSQKIGHKIVLTSWDGSKKITGYIRDPDLTKWEMFLAWWHRIQKKGRSMKNKVYSFIINLLMSLLCIIISLYDYPLEWEEKDLMVRLSRKLFKTDTNDNSFVIIPRHQYNAMMSPGWTNVNGNKQWKVKDASFDYNK